jgi:Na+-driven multidrug efflux pump
MATGWMNMILLGVVGLILVLFPSYFISFFIKDKIVLEAGVECLRIVSIGFIAYGFGMVLVNSFNGAGDTTTPLKINIFAFWCIEIPLAWVLSMRAGMNEKGVFTAIVIAESIMTLTAWIIFRQGKWKLKEV